MWNWQWNGGEKCENERWLGNLQVLCQRAVFPWQVGCLVCKHTKCQKAWQCSENQSIRFLLRENKGQMDPHNRHNENPAFMVTYDAHVCRTSNQILSPPSCTKRFVCVQGCREDCWWHWEFVLVSRMSTGLEQQGTVRKTYCRQVSRRERVTKPPWLADDVFRQPVRRISC